MVYGIDVSHYQGNIDWKQVKAAGKDFCLMKAMMETTQTADATFQRNYRGCVDNCIRTGVYIFIGTKSVENPEADAKAMISILGNRKLDYGVWIDAEGTKLRAQGREKIADVIRREIAVFRAHGYKCGVYSNLDWCRNVLTDDIKKEPLWIARYPRNDDGTVKPNLSPKAFATMWQYSSKGRVSGISGNVDLDIDYGFLPPKSNEDIAREIIAGLWGSASTNPTRKQRLTAAGYDYAAVQAKVNEILKHR